MNGLEPAWQTSLTAREREVASLAAAGKTNKAIAAELSISDKTVEKHLSRAYVKLGVASRSQLPQALHPVGGPAIDATIVLEAAVAKGAMST